jgi:hypothetical protein
VCGEEARRLSRLCMFEKVSAAAGDVQYRKEKSCGVKEKKK